MATVKEGQPNVNPISHVEIDIEENPEQNAKANCCGETKKVRSREKRRDDLRIRYITPCSQLIRLRSPRLLFQIQRDHRFLPPPHPAYLPF